MAYYFLYNGRLFNYRKFRSIVFLNCIVFQSNTIFIYYATDKPADFTFEDPTLEGEQRRASSAPYMEVDLNEGATFVGKF
jgi:hypothetical protein